MPFHYTEVLRGALEIIVSECPLFAHVDLDGVAISFAQSRKRTRHGMFAKLVPLRFPGGRLVAEEGGHLYRIEPFTFRGQDVLYILYVYLPRFHDQSFRDKLLTLFHELYHIGVRFDGDLRRFPGPNPFHGSSREEYDARLLPHVERFLDAAGHRPELDFLRERLETLEARHGCVQGTWIRQPGFVPVEGVGPVEGAGPVKGMGRV